MFYKTNSKTYKQDTFQRKSTVLIASCSIKRKKVIQSTETFDVMNDNVYQSVVVVPRFVNMLVSFLYKLDYTGL